MNKYEKYKDSGIEWIGVIPMSWASVSLKWISKIYSGGTPSKNKPEYWQNGTIPWLNSGSVNQVFIKEPSEYITEDALANSSAKWIPSGSLVIALAGQGKTKGMVAQVLFDTTCNQSLGVISPSPNLESRYLLYWLSKNYQNIRFLGGGDQRDGINLEMVGGIPIPLPSPPEQTAIANYLDHKTAEIDVLVADKKRLLTLYEEEKTALINQAVTKGIDPDVTLKDSGIEWLGEIPKHWVVKKLKHLTEIISKGTTPSTVGKGTTSSGDVRFLKAENISNNLVKSHPENFIDNETNKILSRSELQEGDILFVIAGATIGKVAILSKEFIPSNTNQAVSFIRSKSAYIRIFLWYYLQSATITKIIWLDAVQSAQPNLSMENLGNFHIPIPSQKEIQDILVWIGKGLASISTKTTAVQQQLDLLAEYRTALISEVVTGKIKVTE